MKTLSLYFASLAAVTGAVSASVLDFEQVNGMVPVEGMSISNQFQPYYGITFEKSNGSYPAIAKVGPPLAAFGVKNGGADTPVGTNAPSFGQFFLTVFPDGGGGAANVFIILKFDAPVSNASGYILDIDTSESAFIRAYTNLDGTGTPAAEFTFSGSDPRVGDGVGTPWQISRPTKDILRIELHANGYPVAYDLISSDYTPASAPPPELACRMYPGITISGTAGRPYRVEYADQMDVTPGSTNWHALSTFFLPTPAYLFFDTNAPSGGKRFYQAIALP